MPTSDAPAESDRVYYREWCTGGDVVAEARSILLGLVEEGVAIDAAWFPGECSPCDCATCTAGIVLMLVAPDVKVEALGFRADNPWALNCGVPEMWRFDFE